MTVKALIKSAALLLLIAGLSACHVDANYILRHEGQLTLFQYSHTKVSDVVDFNEPKVSDIPKGSVTYNRLRSWLLNNEAGWSPSSASYLAEYEIKGVGFSIKFGNGIAVLNFQDSEGEFHQYVKIIKEDEYQFLLK